VSSLVRWLLLGLALLGHVAVAPFYIGSGLVAPGWAVLSLYVIWLLLLVGLVLLWRRRPAAALLVPLGAAALVFAVLGLGEQLLGWTA
jgi:uncharacterized SAM-binding protein YcdF (DUF218 family)